MLEFALTRMLVEGMLVYSDRGGYHRCIWHGIMISNHRYRRNCFRVISGPLLENGFVSGCTNGNYCKIAMNAMLTCFYLPDLLTTTPAAPHLKSACIRKNADLCDALFRGYPPDTHGSGLHLANKAEAYIPAVTVAKG